MVLVRKPHGGGFLFIVLPARLGNGEFAPPFRFAAGNYATISLVTILTPYILVVALDVDAVAPVGLSDSLISSWVTWVSVSVSVVAYSTK